MRLVYHNCFPHLPPLCSGFIYNEKGVREGREGGKGAKQHRFCIATFRLGEGGCQENKTTPMENCNVLWICALVRFAIKIDGTRGTFMLPTMTSRETPRIFILPETTSREAPGNCVLPKTTARKTRETFVLAKTDVQQNRLCFYTIKNDVARSARKFCTT